MNGCLMHRFLSNRVIVKSGDITNEKVDAIVNAANSSLLGGGGVDGAIHRAGGSAILEECRKIRSTRYPDGLPTGEAVITNAGNLPSKCVIHTVGPVYSASSQPEAELKNCYLNSLALLKKQGLRSIVFPAISTGVYGYPKEEAAVISSLAVRQFLETDDTIEKVVFIFYSLSDMDIFIKNQKFVQL